MSAPTRRIRNARLRAIAQSAADAEAAADALRMERDAAHEECARLAGKMERAVRAGYSMAFRWGQLGSLAHGIAARLVQVICEDAERIDTITAERDHARAIAVALEQIQSIDVSYIERQIAFSRQAFGPGPRTSGILDHITKEITEVRAAPDDVEEWIDLAILAIDGAWRCGGTPEQIIATFHAKLAKNESRTWPDWRTFPEGVAIEHVRSNVDTRVPMDSDRAPEVEG